MNDELTIERLVPGIPAKEWIRRVLTEPSNFAALPDDSRSLGHIEAVYSGLATNRALFLRPMVDGVPAGLYWGLPWDSGICSVHQFMMPEYRTGFLPVRVARNAAAVAFSMLVDTTRLMGFTPIHDDYRAALVVAERAGFKRLGVLPGFFVRDGVAIDCAIVVKERIHNA